MAADAKGSIPTYTIIQADGVYDDDKVEQEIFSPQNEPGGPRFRVNFVKTDLSPAGITTFKPWSSIDRELRDKIDGIMVLKMGFTATDLELFPNLKVLVRMGVGYDRVDRAALATRGVTLCNVPDYGTCEIADHAMAHALSLRRGLILHHDQQRANPPAAWTYIDTPLVARVQQATFGILGLGMIGTAVALRAKAFGWNVLFYDPYSPMGVDKSLGVQRTRDIRDLFSRSTTLSVHCPATPETQNIVSYELLSLMPRGAILINTARGEVVDLDAVERCLKEGILAGAGLDVLPDEPIPVEGPVHSLIQAYRDREPWLAGRLVITPHSAYHSPESLVDIRIKSCETMRDVLLNGLMVNVIAPPKV